MTTKVKVEAHCASTKEVKVEISGLPDITLQDGDSTEVYAYDERVISIKEIEKQSASEPQEIQAETSCE